MNQTISSTENPQSCDDLPNKAELDFWGLLLAALLVSLRHWKLLVFGPLIIGIIALAGSFLLPKSYISYAYVGPLNDEMARKSSALIVSPPVVDAALRKLSKSLPAMTPDEGMRYLTQRIRFRSLQGADSKLTSLYVLEVLDAEPSRAHGLLSAIIDAWLTAMKPPPEKLASLQRMQEAFEAQSVDVSQAIALLLTHPELLKADIKSGSMPNNVADMIKLRTDGIVKSEDLKSSIAGLGRDIVVVPPIVPAEPVGPAKYEIALMAVGITFVALLLVVVFRGVLVPVLNRSKYAPSFREIARAFR